MRLGPIRMTLGKKGVGVSVGVRGARVGIGADGRPRTSMTIPGTGWTYRTTGSALGAEATGAQPADAPLPRPGTSPFVAILLVLFGVPTVIFVVALGLVVAIGPRPAPVASPPPQIVLGPEQHLAEAERLLALAEYTTTSLASARQHLDSVPRQFESRRRRAVAHSLASGEARLGEEAIRETRRAIREDRYDDARAAVAAIPEASSAASRRVHLLHEIDLAEQHHAQPAHHPRRPSP